MKNIVTTDWLMEHMTDENLVIVDCRFELGKPAAGQAAFKESHIPGAVHMDLEKDLSGEKQVHGGRHPLPKMEDFVSVLGNAGIDEKTRVIAYDDGDYAFAARLWWMLKYLGHEQVYVLDGGYKEWVEKDYPVTSDLTGSEKKTYAPSLREDLLVEISNVKEVIESGAAQLVDARAPERYTGKVEPIDPVGGHIPTALNFFYQGNLKEGKLKSVVELKENFEELAEKQVISYCGSGVTACVNVLAMDEAGITSKLYLGSWSDWSSYKDNPVEKKE